MRHGKKVGTIVIAVSVCVFTLLQFPGISEHRMQHFQTEMDKAMKQFSKQTGNGIHAGRFTDEKMLLKTVNLYSDYKTAKLNAKGAAAEAVEAAFREKHPEQFIFLKPGDKEAASATRRWVTWNPAGNRFAAR